MNFLLRNIFVIVFFEGELSFGIIYNFLSRMEMEGEEVSFLKWGVVGGFDLWR